MATISHLLWNLVNIAVKRDQSRHEMPSTNTQEPRSGFCGGGSCCGKATSKRSALVSIIFQCIKTLS